MSWIISPDRDIAGYVQLEFKCVLESDAISNLCTAKYAFKNCTLAKLWAKMLFRFQ